MSAHQSKILRFSPASARGFVYLVQAVGTDKFKIGKATDVLNRLRALQTGSPLKIRYVYHAYCQNMNVCEMELHQKFSEQREIGEWFALTQEDVKFCILLMRLMREIEPSQYPKLPLEQQHQISSILQCHAKGIKTKNRILKEVWG